MKYYLTFCFFQQGKAVLAKKGTSEIQDVIGEARSMIEQSLRAVVNYNYRWLFS